MDHPVSRSINAMHNMHIETGNPGSKPQRLNDKNCKSCTWKLYNKFCHCFQTSVKKLYIEEKKNVFFPSATFSREITEPLRKIKIRLKDLWENVLYMAARLLFLIDVTHSWASAGPNFIIRRLSHSPTCC